MSHISVVTGGTYGIGRCIVEKILEDSRPGDHVFVSFGHDSRRADEFFDDLPWEHKKRITFWQADMSCYEQMLLFAEEIKGHADHVDWLVNNVGVSTSKKFEDYTFEEWGKIINTNLSVPAFLVQELKPFMREGGSVLFTGSYAGQQAYSSSLVYGVSKAAVHFLAKSLVKEMEPKAVRVNAIAPGFIETDWHRDRTDESYERINKKIALHRFGEPDEVADMALAILKNEYMNGSVVDIHGGYDFF